MIHIRSVILAFALVLMGTCALVAQHSPKPMVVGYVFPKNAILQAGQIDAHSMTRINYAFANIKNGRIVLGNATDPQNFSYLTGLKKQNPSLTVLVSVGGWTWSGDFSDVSLTAESRRVFIDSVMEFLSRYNLDGLDVDWEYPGLVGSGHRFRAKDKQNFTLLIGELRHRFDIQSRKKRHRLYLTIAAGAANEYLQHTEMAKVEKYVDSVNLMAYDYYEPSGDKIAAHHAPLFTSPEDPKKISADASVRAFEKAGVPARKILLGVPFYGHLWADVDDRAHGLFQAGKPAPNGYAPYSLITQTMLDHGYVRYWDETASVPYLYNPDKKIFVSYEDPTSLKAKSQYILRHKLGGAMFWDYFSDPSGVLLQTLNESLHRVPVKGGTK